MWSEGGRDWLSYHYYDGEQDGKPWVEVRQAVVTNIDAFIGYHPNGLI